jgi:hypothetical protein
MTNSYAKAMRQPQRKLPDQSLQGYRAQERVKM